MTTHDLARLLLAGADLPVEAQVSGFFGDDAGDGDRDYDAVWGAVTGLETRTEGPEGARVTRVVIKAEVADSES